MKSRFQFLWVLALSLILLPFQNCHELESKPDQNCWALANADQGEEPAVEGNENIDSQASMITHYIVLSVQVLDGNGQLIPQAEVRTINEENHSITLRPPSIYSTSLTDHTLDLHSEDVNNYLVEYNRYFIDYFNGSSALKLEVYLEGELRHSEFVELTYETSEGSSPCFGSWVHTYLVHTQVQVVIEDP